MWKKKKKPVARRPKKAVVVGAASVSSSCSQSQKHRIATTKVKTKRVIYRRNDGSSRTEEYVTSVTKAEEVISEMKMTTEAIRQKTITSFKDEKHALYETANILHDRMQFVNNQLGCAPSPFSDDTLLASVASMSLGDLLVAERQFLMHALEESATIQSVLQSLPPASALTELITGIVLDFETYLPYQLYMDAAYSEELEHKMERADWLRRQERILHSWDGHKEAKRMKSLLDTGVVHFGDRDYHESVDLDEGEKLREDLASAEVGRSLNNPGWHKSKDLHYDGHGRMFERGRMEEAMVLYDGLTECITDKTAFVEGGIWSLLQSRLCEHYLLMKLLAGGQLDQESIGIHPQGVRAVPIRQLHADSFFHLDHARSNARSAEDVGVFSVLIAGVPEIHNVVLEMSVLHRLWSSTCSRITKCNVDQYRDDTRWGLFTPENLIRMQLGCEDAATVEALDKLAGPHVLGARNQVLSMAEKFYMNRDAVDDIHMDRIASLFPPAYRAQLDMVRGSRSQHASLDLGDFRRLRASAGSRVCNK